MSFSARPTLATAASAAPARNDHRQRQCTVHPAHHVVAVLLRCSHRACSRSVLALRGRHHAATDLSPLRWQGNGILVRRLPRPLSISTLARAYGYRGEHRKACRPADSTSPIPTLTRCDPPSAQRSSPAQQQPPWLRPALPPARAHGCPQSFHPPSCPVLFLPQAHMVPSFFRARE